MIALLQLFVDVAILALLFFWCRRDLACDRVAPLELYEADDTCNICSARLVFSARQRGDGLCGPCSREAET